MKNPPDIEHKNIANALEYIDEYEQIAIEEVDSFIGVYGFPKVTITFKLKDD